MAGQKIALPISQIDGKEPGTARDMAAAVI
jgi:hypothetical protein